MRLCGGQQRLRHRLLRRCHHRSRLAAAALCGACASAAAAAASSAGDVRQIGELERLSTAASTHAAAATGTATTATAATNQLDLWQRLDACLRHRRKKPQEALIERLQPTHRRRGGGSQRHL